MCVLCVMPPNHTPTYRQLSNSCENNPDGFGYAFHCGDRIITGRGMEADEMIDRFLRIRSGMPNTWAMFHARITTHGETNKANCHPFRMNGDEATVIGHNGILPVNVPKGDKRSDTRIFADEILPSFLPLLDNEKEFEALETVIGSSKVAIFTYDERLESNVYILNEGLGKWDEGIWWSNDTYKYVWASPTRGGYYYGLDGKKADIFDDPYLDPDKCNYCLSRIKQEEIENEVCLNCMTCQLCAEDVVNCICYVPVRQANYKHLSSAWGFRKKNWYDEVSSDEVY